MKKVIFTAVALTMTIVGSAQNVSEVDQSGTNNADVNQTSTGMFVNMSDVDQNGASNDAQVNQVGNNNSIVNQMGTSNMADINQVGGNGTSIYGNTNYSTANQNGVGNVIDVDQISTGHPASADVSIVNQDNAASAGDGNYARILQGGWNNQSLANQNNDDNSVFIDQTGGHNQSISNQTSDGGIASVGAGFEQESTVKQRGRWNLSDVAQDGSNNDSSVDQSTTASWGTAGPISNVAMIDQNGYSNSSMLVQGDSLAGADGNNTMTVMQTNVSITGPGNVSMGNQMGGNTANVTQTNL
ncbi:hypothetical protein [Ulvibacter litoralis]|uniref:Curlin associated repeat-containing protein n=1 Tax=Ulvibacter litoralis TaxID=227084 RepID=A0A1G7GNB5_9FLAO|nr:hypothetical protein [Ulvibacter litoralis]GHC55602.1 hypothetical protein GCM10008083_19770 [Ulvibacter litoralis]SDE89658.1 Curlin associated repeat-containing protein [Ulvibacter litoralis]